MPKLKTNRGAKKRFKRTGTGLLKRRAAFRNHILTKKKSKRKRQLRTPDALVSPHDMKSVNRLLAGS